MKQLFLAAFIPLCLLLSPLSLADQQLGSTIQVGGYSAISFDKRYFVCFSKHYRPDRTYTACAPPAWYSTAPWYQSERFIYAHHPQYVCPRFQTDDYVIFQTAGEARLWYSRNCNKWEYHRAQLRDNHPHHRHKDGKIRLRVDQPDKFRGYLDLNF